MLALLCLGFVFAACGDDEEAVVVESRAPESSELTRRGKEIQKVSGADGKTVTVGSKNFTEQFVLGEIYSQALEAARLQGQAGSSTSAPS